MIISHSHTFVLVPTEEREKRKKSDRKLSIPKDRHAPKKPITAYNLYAVDERIRVSCSQLSCLLERYI